MNIALFAQSVFFRSLQGLVQGLRSGRTRAHQTVTKPIPVWHSDAPVSIAASGLNSGATGRIPVVARPLRVVRVLEAGQDHCGVGRMVISGRMADVCAELDRLAAREAACS